MKISNNKARLLTALIATNTIIFLILSLIHFYWAFGGRLWYNEVLPTNSTGSKRMEPGLTTGFIIAFGLLLLAFITIGNQGLLDKYINRKYLRYGTLVISVIFFIRAIGDFKFFGFFKTIKETSFASNDTVFFSPLCVFTALISLFIFAMKKNEK
jgi:hypothetical protein